MSFESQRSKSHKVGARDTRVASLSCAALAIAGSLLCPTSGRFFAETPPTLEHGHNREYQLKAAYLYRISRNINWPANVFEGESSPFVIGVLGESPITPPLQSIGEHKTFHGRKLDVYQTNSVEELKACHILFVSQTLDEKARNAAVQWCRGQHVLLVGETDDFARQGGIVSFVIRERRIRVQINPGVLQGEGLTMNRVDSRMVELVKDP